MRGFFRPVLPANGPRAHSGGACYSDARVISCRVPPGLLEGSLLSHDDHYRAVFEASPDATLIVDSEGLILDVNEQAVRMFGWSREALTGALVERLVPSKKRGAHLEHRKRYVREPRSRPMGARLELYAVRKDGTEFPVEISLSPWIPPRGAGQVICAIRDISAWERMRKRSELMMAAMEQERKRLSLELHDEVLQCLVSLKIRVRLMRDETDDGKRAREGEQIRGEILDTFNAVKRMIGGLRPPELERQGLTGALRDHFRLLRDSGGFQVDAEVGDVDDELDEMTALALYRVVQEAVANAARHSGERSATVRVASGGGCVVAEIRDRGRGFELRDPGSAGPYDQMGITGMTERAAMVGGDVTIETAPGRGTLVRLTIPVRGTPATPGVSGP